MNPLAKRIDLNKFIKTLVNLYNTGADYIDLEYISDELPEPFVRIHVKDVYMADNVQRKEELYEAQQFPQEETYDDDEEDDSPLSEEDFDKLA